MFNPKGKVALVTGGASGIGLAYVRELLKSELKGVTIVDNNETLGKTVCEEVTKEFGKDKAIFVHGNVSDKVQIKDAIEKTVSFFNQFDILVNNAGILNELDWEKTLTVNLIPVLNASMLAIDTYFPKYKSSEEAIIINTSSVSGIFGYDGMPFYCASKHGIVGFTKAMGPLFSKQKKVKAVCICPFMTNTPFAKNPYVNLPEPFFTMYTELQEKAVYQPTELIAKAGLRLMMEAPSGTVWHIENGKVSEVKNPSLVEI